MTFDYNPTTRVIFGEEAIQKAGELIRELGAKRVLVVTDAGIVKTGHVGKLTSSLKQNEIGFIIFQEVEENPTTRHVENGVRFAKENGPVDLIVGIGGGSAMDCAKGINFLLTNGGKMEDYQGYGKAREPMLPSVGIPTTAGTGSEGQSYALITHPETHQKMACGDLKARFTAVILDPTLLKTVPNKVAVVTGIDAISHAIESYVSTRRNAISQIFSREAIKRLFQNFEKFLSTPGDIDAAGNMLLGAHFAGAAIENSMLGAAHACANPLTAHFDITHGIAVGLMLPHVIRFNTATVNGYYDDLAQSAGLNGKGSEELVATILKFVKKNQLPTMLRDCHVSETELPELAEEAAKQWTGQFNPRPVGNEEFLELYKKAY